MDQELWRVTLDRMRLINATSRFAGKIMHSTVVGLMIFIPCSLGGFIFSIQSLAVTGIFLSISGCAIFSLCHALDSFLSFKFRQMETKLWRTQHEQMKKCIQKIISRGYE